MLFTFQLKLKNMVTTQQEKLLGEKDVVIERQKYELQAIKDDLAKKLDEVQCCSLHLLTSTLLSKLLVYMYWLLLS